MRIESPVAPGEQADRAGVILTPDQRVREEAQRTPPGGALLFAVEDT